jgi:acyl carrier protein
MDYREDVRAFVIKNFLFGDPGELADDTSFIRDGIFNSTGVLELIAFLEGRYGIVVEDAELVPENLDTLRDVARFVAAKVAERVARPA